MKKHVTRKQIAYLNSITDLEKLIRKDLVLTGNGKNKYALCPFHKERTPSFCVVTHKKYYYCFGCGVSGKAFDYLHTVRYKDWEGYGGTNYRKALADLISFNNISIKTLRTIV